MGSVIVVLIVAVGSLPAAAQGCSVAGWNTQCNQFGTIAMESQRDVRGAPIDLVVSVTLHTSFSDRDTRWLLFSVRNVTDDGGSPVSLAVTRFATSSGPVVTTKVDHERPNEANLWVHVLDAPVGAPIEIGLRVGVSERGAFRLETLVMAFDRGYTPVRQDDGSEASLFSFTLLGVNQASASVSSGGGPGSNGGFGGGLLSGKKLPGPELVALAGGLGAAALVASRLRRDA
ncbi:MAG TPA: hypothetical protein VM681_10370 [Candidatus Thermoplasmatota archaeon]|nr:hypothetical protein [Candidatus Thermoplasmatota archaeon]